MPKELENYPKTHHSTRMMDFKNRVALRILVVAPKVGEKGVALKVGEKVVALKVSEKAVALNVGEKAASALTPRVNIRP